MKLTYGLVACAAARAAASAVNITYYRDEPLAPTPLPPSHAETDGDDIIRLFQNLGLSTVWKSVANISLEGDTGEPEGMVRLGSDRYVVSTGDWVERTEKYDHIINGTDRTPGKGYSHLKVYTAKGELIADATITETDEIEYHNGGIDWDGESIWGTNAQYRPNTTAHVYKADPYTMATTTVLRYNDHLGGIVHDSRDNIITCINWGSRNATSWDLDRVSTGCKAHPEPRSVVRNPSYFIDYQDCKWLGRSRFYRGKSVALCSGVATIGGNKLGGVALVDVDTMVPLAEVPIALQSALGVTMTQNPVDVSVHDGRLRLHWMPDQHNSTIYVYEAQPDSPFQFGGGRQ